MTSLRGLVARATRAVRRHETDELPPLVSVVVPVYQAEAYLDECLRSLRAQTYDRMQIVIVDDGSTDGSREVYERHAALDDRIEVVRQENRGLGAARNVGIGRSRGDYLAFVDADDVVPPKALRRMVRALQGSGSDFVIGAVQRSSSGRQTTPRWIREVHREERRGITIDDFPRAVMDVIACNRMFRATSWTSLGLTFPEGVAYEDHVPMMTAYVRGRFDVLQATTYIWRIREDLSSIGQQKHEVANLRDRLTAKRAAREVVAREASQAVQEAWQARVLDMDLRRFIDEVPGADAEYWAALRDGVREHVERATARVWDDVRVEQRVRAWLVAQDDRASLEALIGRATRDEPVVRAEVRGSTVVAMVDLPPSAQPPADLLVVGERELVLDASLRTATVEGTDLELVLALRVGPITDGLDRASLSARLVSSHGQVVQVPCPPADAETAVRAAATFSGPGWPDVRVLRIAAGALPGDADHWDIHLDYSIGSRTFRGLVALRDSEGSAGRLPSLPIAAGRLVPVWRPHGGLSLAVAPHDAVPSTGRRDVRPLLVVEDADLGAEGLELRGRWIGGPAPTTIVLLGYGGATLPVELSGPPSAARLRVSWTAPPAPGRWQISAPGSRAAFWMSDDLLAHLPDRIVTAGSGLRVIRDTDDAPALRVVLLRD